MNMAEHESNDLTQHPSFSFPPKTDLGFHKAGVVLLLWGRAWVRNSKIPMDPFPYQEPFQWVPVAVIDSLCSMAFDRYVLETEHNTSLPSFFNW